ncbi:MAG: hypothetical protein M0Q13_12275 [Methanothrix sp.]|jgi:hypothetical protein|nr:hypothetical protein [Methanothrix sp.]
MNFKNIERLSKLGITSKDSEIELLRNNINLKKENDILRKNFEDTIKNIIVSIRFFQQPNEQIIYPYIDGTSNDRQVRFLNGFIQESNFNYESDNSNLNIYEMSLDYAF